MATTYTLMTKLKYPVGIRKCKPKYQEKGSIDDARYCDADRGLISLNITIHHAKGGHQGFGGISFKDKDERDKFLRSLYWLFDCSSLAGLVNKKCISIYNQESYNEYIVGIGNTEKLGLFLILDAWREDIGYPRYNTIAYKKQQLQADVRQRMETVARLNNEIDSLNSKFDEIY